MITICRTTGVGLIVLLLGVSAASSGQLDRKELIEDVRQLANTIEDVHPDPYMAGGGKIAFNRRLHQTLIGIPEQGMTVEEFYRHLRPFVASVGDAHTWLWDPYQFDPYAPGGVPLYFETILDGLYVMAVLGEENRHFLGAKLISVEGVTLDELLRRQGERMGAENKYLLLNNLAGQGVLWKRCFLEHLVPEWLDKSQVTVELLFPDGRVDKHSLAIPGKIDYSAFVFHQRRIQLTSIMTSLQKTDFAYDFLDSTRQTCLLVVNGMSGYREAFEIWDELGVTAHDDRARDVYRRYHGTEAPSEMTELIAGIPSATELFRSMVVEMKKAGTENLLIDLRHNGGGNSAMYNILIYMLYGREALLDLKGHGLEIRRLSQTYFERYEKESLDSINVGRVLPLEVGDCDFQYDFVHSGYPGREAVTRDFESFAEMMPTFYDEWRTGEHDRYYLPGNVMVLSSAGTFSSGYTMLSYLNRAGAVMVGVPSSQGGNCYGDILGFKLKNSGLSFNVSHKYFELYPGDRKKGTVLMPEYPLTYEKLAKYGFDPDAAILYALDIIADIRATRESK